MDVTITGVVYNAYGQRITGAQTLQDDYAASLIQSGLATLATPGQYPLPPTTSSSYIPYTGFVIGDGSGSLPNATNPLFCAINTANNYTQDYVWNKSTGVNASADFIAYPSNGTDAAGWVDMGITSPNFSQAAYGVTVGNEAYLFASAPAGSGKTGNLVICTDSTGTANKIQMATGGFTTKSNVRAEISSLGLAVTAAGAGLLVKEGTNCKQGTAVLAAGTVTVGNSSVTANSRIFIQRQTDGGTVGASYSLTRSAGVSFTITSRDGTGAAQTLDTSTVAYQIFEPG